MKSRWVSMLSACAVGGLAIGAGASVTDLTADFGGTYTLQTTNSAQQAVQYRTTATMQPDAVTIGSTGWVQAQGSGTVTQPGGTPQGFVPGDAGTGTVGINTSTAYLRGNLDLNRLDHLADPGSPYVEGAINVGVGRRGTVGPDDNTYDGFGLWLAQTNESTTSGRQFFIQATEETGYQSDSPWVAFDLNTHQTGAFNDGPVNFDFEIAYWQDPTLTNGDHGRYEMTITVGGPSLGSAFVYDPAGSDHGASYNATTQTITLTGTYGDDFDQLPPISDAYGGVFVNSQYQYDDNAFGLGGTMEFDVNSLEHELVTVTNPGPYPVPIADGSLLEPATYAANSYGAGGWDVGIWYPDPNTLPWVGSHPNEFVGQPWNPGPRYDNLGTIGPISTATALLPGESPDGFIGQVFAPVNTGTPDGNGNYYAYASNLLSSVLEPHVQYDIQALMGLVDSQTSADGIAALEVWAGPNLLLRVEQDQTLVTPGTLDLIAGSFVTNASTPGLGLPIEIRIVNGGNDRGDDVQFDEVYMQKTYIPEPASLMLLVLGGLTMLRRR